MALAPRAARRARVLHAAIWPRQSFADQNRRHVATVDCEYTARAAVVACLRTFRSWPARAGNQLERWRSPLDQVAQAGRGLCDQAALAFASRAVARLWRVVSNKANRAALVTHGV